MMKNMEQKTNQNRHYKN